MTNSDRARNDMLYSLYRSITSISTHTLHSHSHTHTHTHSVHSFARLSALLMICKKCSPCLVLPCLVEYPVKGKQGGHIHTYCWHIALAFPCLLFLFIVVARVFHLHDKNQWQRLRRNAKLRFRPSLLFLSLSLPHSFSAPLYLHLAHMRTVLRVGVARSAQNTISVSD